MNVKEFYTIANLMEHTNPAMPLHYILLLKKDDIDLENKMLTCSGMNDNQAFLVTDPHTWECLDNVKVCSEKDKSKYLFL